MSKLQHAATGQQPQSFSAEDVLAAALEAYGARRIADAAPLFERGLALGLDPERGAGERWMCAMLAGDFEAAWRESDRILRRRLAGGESCARESLNRRWVWRGTPLEGRDVLIRCYHGLGDTLHFIRYATPLRRIANSVTVEAQPALMPLLACVRGVDRLVAPGEPVSGIGAEIESTELPHAFRTTLDSIPGKAPYLAVPPDSLAAARRRLAHAPGLKVGLVWAAGAWRPERSIELAALAPLASVPGVSFVSLQRGPAEAELGEAGPLQGIHHPLESDDIMPTAALVSSLDLVISVDTMVAHLAGALGVPVWTLLHFHADWRWMHERLDSPWYPTMRLFRQQRPGVWGVVIREVVRELAATAGKVRRAPTSGAPYDDRS